jgi:hypothetical protein
MYEWFVDLVDDDGLLQLLSFEELDEAAANALAFGSSSAHRRQRIQAKIDFSDSDAGRFADCIGSISAVYDGPIRFIAVLERCGSRISILSVEIEGD